MTFILALEYPREWIALFSPDERTYLTLTERAQLVNDIKTGAHTPIPIFMGDIPVDQQHALRRGECISTQTANGFVTDARMDHLGHVYFAAQGFHEQPLHEFAAMTMFDHNPSDGFVSNRHVVAVEYRPAHDIARMR